MWAGAADRPNWRALLIGAAIVAAVAAGYLGCRPTAGDRGSAPQPAGPADRLTLFLTGATGGNMEPCNCPGQPLGGFSRRQTLLNSLRTRYGPGVLLDTGNMLQFERDAILDRYVAAGFGLLGYDAIGMGDKDIDRGWDKLAALARNARLPMVATNLASKAIRLGEPYRWIRRDGRNVLVVGVIGELALAFGAPQVLDQLRVSEPAEAVRQALAQTQRDHPNRRADLLIVLACLDSAEEKETLARLAEVRRLDDGRGDQSSRPGTGGPIDLVVLNSEKDREVQLERIAGLPVIRPPGRGRQIAAVVFSFQPPAAATQGDFQEQTAAGSAWIARADGCPVELGLDRDKSLWELYQSYTYDAQRKALEQLGKTGPIRFTGSDTCGRQCHPVQFEFWRKHKHGQAWETIVGEQRAGDPNCMRCHTTGYGFLGGFQAPEKTPELAGVGCQDCHQVDGSPHLLEAAAGKTNPATRPHKELTATPPELCKTCHTVATSPKFAPEEYLPKATCPKDSPARPATQSGPTPPKAG